jgi:predicted nucleotidyltransferase
VSIASLQEIETRFGTSTPRRQFLFRQLQNLFNRLLVVGGVKKVFLFGSFVTGKASPNDIDLLLVMNGAFSTANVSGQDVDIFQHDLCRIRFYADLFWVTESVGADRIEDLLDVFSRNRDGRPQPIIEVQL